VRAEIKSGSELGRTMKEYNARRDPVPIIGSLQAVAT
jgi:hypothetical protein